MICSVCVLTVEPKLFGTCAFIVPSISVRNEMLVLFAKVRNFICWSCGRGMKAGVVNGYLTNTLFSDNQVLKPVTSPIWILGGFFIKNLVLSELFPLLIQQNEVSSDENWSTGIVSVIKFIEPAILSFKT